MIYKFPKQLINVSIQKIPIVLAYAHLRGPGDYGVLYKANITLREDESVLVIFRGFDINPSFHNMGKFYENWNIMSRRVLAEKLGKF